MSSSTGPFLNAQIELYGVQSEAAAASRTPPLKLDRRDIEDAIALGLTTFANLRRHSGLWAAEAALRNTEFAWETSRHFSDQYQRWKQRTAKLLNAVDFCKADGLALVGEQELRAAFKDVSLMVLDTDRTKTAFESLQAGEGISHREAMDELRHRLAARRP